MSDDNCVWFCEEASVDDIWRVSAPRVNESMESVERIESDCSLNPCE